MTANIAERHQHIINKLREHGHISVQSLSDDLKVSSVTIRKDLRQLEDKKLLFRTHGSATLINPYINDRPVNEKEKIRVAQKQRIARRAATMTEAQDSIILASGTTIIEMARQITAVQHLTVITASLNAALILSRNTGIDIMQLGGMIRKSSSSVVGHYAENYLNDFSCTKLFLGVDGIDPEYGLTTTNTMEAMLNQKMIKAVQRVIVLADSSKFGRRGFSRICGFSDVDIIITDNEVSPSIVKKMEEAGIEVILC